MIVFKKKFLFFSVTEVWFGYYGTFIEKIGLCAFMHVKGSSKSKISGVKNISYTVENELENTEEDILNSFSKTIKVEINQAKKIGVNTYFSNNINEFITFYNDFAKNRNIDLISERRLNEMKPNLKLSFAIFENNILAAHSYLEDKELGIVRLMHAATARFSDQGDKQLAGRANKLLHYTDMVAFKKDGIKIYDFGGYAEGTNDKGLQGINKFKLSFGGSKVECINYSSYTYFVLKKLASLLGLLGKS